MIGAAVTEIEAHLADAIGKFLAAQQAQMAQLETIEALKAEVAKLKGWAAEKEKYELKTVGSGIVAYMNKPSARGTEPPHWLCPTCFENGKKSPYLFSVRSTRGSVYRCKGCDGHVVTNNEPEWL